MSDLGDTFKAFKEDGQKRRDANAERGRRRTKIEGFPFTELSAHHLRRDHWDFWPSTGLFINRKTGKRGRGVQNLLDALRYEKKTQGKR